MNDTITAERARQPLEWQAHEYVHTEKTSEWYWALGLLALACSVAALLYNNGIFALLILIGAFVLALFASRRPPLVTFNLSQRGIRIDDAFYPFNALKSFAVHELSPNHIPKLILEARHGLMRHIIIPIEGVHADDVHDFLVNYLPEEDHAEPLIIHVMEWLGF